MNEQLLLQNIRSVLSRLEETIIFALIERAQFLANPVIYEPGEFTDSIGPESVTGFLLHQTEKVHAKLRRYTSPDEHPFFDGLPEPVLPELDYRESPLHPNAINLNARIRRCYESEIVPFVCKPGDDQQYGSSAVCDVACLQSMSKRIHYGMFVAESKYRGKQTEFDQLIAARDTDGILAAITDNGVEAKVLARVGDKVRSYGQIPNLGHAGHGIEPETIVEVFRRWIIPLTKDVEVDYLMRCYQ